MDTASVTFFITIPAPHTLSDDLVTNFTIRNVKYKPRLEMNRKKQIPIHSVHINLTINL